MSSQVVLSSAPIELFEVVDGVTESLGKAACSIVGQPGTPPRYKLVCFDDQRRSLCTATIAGSNEHSLGFTLQTSDFACFRDDEDKSFNMLFLRSLDVEPFMAQLAGAFYGVSGQPSHSTVIADFAHQLKRVPGPGNEVLELGRRAKVRFVAYSIKPGETSADLPVVTTATQAANSGDSPYAFEAVQSAYSLPADGYGFEASVLGMIQETWRAIVVPSTMPRNSKPADSTLVFLVFLKRVVHDPTADTGSAVAEARATARIAASRNSSALVIAGADGRRDDGPPKPVRSDPKAPGSGIPAEHMLLVQKVAAQVNTAVSSLRDLQDKVDAFNGEWKQTVTRPKPSILPNAALEQNLRNLINENERAREELERRDELMHAIEQRNRDLQKRVDKAAQLAQTLMDEKKKAVSQTSDMRLEMDRQNMRLQEQVTQAQSERDDIQRHLETVKKLLGMSDDALKDTKGKFDIVTVQVRGTADKLDAAEEQLGEERTRRKAFEAKVAALHEELRNAMTEVKLKSAELDDVTRKADADRIYHQQLMEDERERRSIESAQLRSEIVTELQNREAKFQADRQRVSADNFDRGREEGVELGRRNARIDLEHRMQELQLEAQRTRTELDAYKTQLRETQDEAMAENRKLEAAVAALKVSTEDATKTKAKNEYMIHSLKLKVKHAQDALVLGLTTTCHRLSRTIEPTDLLAVLDALHRGDPRPSLDFETYRLDAECAAAQERREQWIADEALRLHEEGLAKIFDDVFAPCHAAFADLNADIARLWYERDIQFLEQAMAAEASVRNGLVTEEDVSFELIVRQRKDEIAAQQAIVAEEASLRPEIVAEYDDFAADLASFIVEQACARQGVAIEQEADYAALMAEEDIEWREARESFERIIFEKVIAEQEAVMSDEEHARIAVADDESTDAGAFRQQFADEAAAIRDMLAERARVSREQREEIESGESHSRVEAEMDEDTERGGLERLFEDTRPRPPTPPRTPTPPPRSPTPPQPVVEEEKVSNEPPPVTTGVDGTAAVPPPQSSTAGNASFSSSTGDAPAPPPPTAPPAQQPQQQQQQPAPAPPMPPAKAKAKGAPPKEDLPRFVVAEDTESDVGSLPNTGRGAPPARPPPKKQQPAPKRSANPFGDDLLGGGAVEVADDSGSDKETPRPRPKPAAKPGTKPAPKPAVDAGALFENSDDDSRVAPVAPPPKAAPKPGAKPSVAASNLFGSDSDTETPRPVAAAPRAKPGKKPAAKPAALFGSDSD